MSDDTIILSPKYGLNPSILQCPICHKDTGIAVLGKLKGDVEAPKYMQNRLCEDCQKQYITIHEVTHTDHSDSYTGKLLFVKREAITESFRKYNDLLMDYNEFEEYARELNKMD